MLIAKINQNSLSARQKIPVRLINRLFAEVSRKARCSKDLSVSLAFVRPAAMKKINRAYRGENRATDVLSFAFVSRSKAVSGEMLGEVLICHNQAVKNTQARGLRVREEICRLITHGLLHLLGHGHASSVAAKKMFALQERVIKDIL